MANETLKQQLLGLHQALAAGEPLDPEMVALLQVLDADIRAALAQTPSPAQASSLTQSQPQITAGLTSRAQEISARFAAQHPHLEPVLRELTDKLQRIGI